VPSPISPPAGCAFHPRCPFADARCRAERPELVPVEGGAVACHAVEEGRIDAG
jgi:peptide/nickel transport system ATP-binding protein